MKILHIISQAPDFTGSGKYIQAVLKCSFEKGHDNFLAAGIQGSFTLDPSIIPTDKTMFVRFDGVDINYPLPGMSDVMPYKSSIFSTLSPSQISEYKAAFKRVIKEAYDKFKPDIIHSHHLWIVSAVTRELLPDIPMVATCHGTCLRQFSLCADIGKEIGDTLKKIDKIMALSNYQKQEIIRIHGIAPESIEVVGGGYDENLFFFEKKAAPMPAHILYAGKLSCAKGVPWLLKSLKRLITRQEEQAAQAIQEEQAGQEIQKEHINNQLWHLHIAGGGSGVEKEECLKLADELNSISSKVTVHGALSHNELAKLMRKCHLFILPSFFEGLPLVLMEALACGCRVITTSLPGTCEVLGGCYLSDDLLNDPSSRNSNDSHKIYKDFGKSMVTLVDLPELETVDKPYDKDMEELEIRLAQTIAKSINNLNYNLPADIGTLQNLTQNYRWKEVFSRIENVYIEVKADSGIDIDNSNDTFDGDILIKNGRIVTVDSQNSIINNGAVLVKADTIIKIGTSQEMADITAKCIIDAENGIIMPGLINTHTHLPMSLFRGFADDMPLTTWLNNYIFKLESQYIKPDTVMCGTLLSSAEMLLSGTTACCDGYFYEEYVAKAVDEIGMRAVLGQGVIDFPAPGVADPSVNIENAANYARQFKNKYPLIKSSIFCHSPYTCSKETLIQAKNAARDIDILFQIHVAETRSEHDQIRQLHQKTTVEYLDGIGILDQNTLMVHAVWVTDNDVEIIRQSGAAISHNPESNMKLGSGIAPVLDFIRAGIPTGLGTDGSASNNNLDLFTEMDSAAKLHKVHRCDVGVLDVLSVLRMATIEGAKAIGLGDITGSLEMGKKADIIILDTHKPHFVPMYNPVSHLVYSAAGADVRDVIIDGKIVVKDRKITTVDLDSILLRASEFAVGIKL